MSESQLSPPARAGHLQISSVQSIYFNGFEVGTSLSDMALLIMLEGLPIARLNMSFTTAKTLSKTLAEAVGQFEAATKHNVMTMDEVKDGFDRIQGK